MGKALEPGELIAEVDPNLSERESIFVECYLLLDHHQVADCTPAEIAHAIEVMHQAHGEFNEMLVEAVLPKRRSEDLCRNF
jgi:hypothetical protein